MSATVSTIYSTASNNNSLSNMTTTAEASARPRRNLHRRTRSTNSVDPTLLAELRASKEAPKDFFSELNSKRASVVSLPALPNGRRSLDERPHRLPSDVLSNEKPNKQLMLDYQFNKTTTTTTTRTRTANNNNNTTTTDASSRGMMLIAPAQSSVLSPPLSLTSAATAPAVSDIDGDGAALPPTSLRLPPAIPNRPLTRLPLRGRKLRLDPINNCVRLNNIEGEIRLRSPVMEVDESDLEDEFSTYNESMAPTDEVCSLGSSNSQRSSRDSSMLPSPSPSQPYLPICPPISHPPMAHHHSNDREEMIGIPVKEEDLSLKGIGIGIGIEIDTSNYDTMNKRVAIEESPATVATTTVDYRKTQVIERPTRSSGGLRWDIWRLCWQA
ncbi:hypothetical protein BDF22DRAFT_657535 [Syncephalis plumigaleata]|nr:hypothetical protein BDF22DRAFT_657535 [Syncephalis plumigaleata]